MNKSIGAMPLNTMTLSIMTFSQTTLTLKGLFATLSINDNQHSTVAFSMKGLFVTLSRNDTNNNNNPIMLSVEFNSLLC